MRKELCEGPHLSVRSERHRGFSHTAAQIYDGVVCHFVRAEPQRERLRPRKMVRSGFRKPQRANWRLPLCRSGGDGDERRGRQRRELPQIGGGLGCLERVAASSLSGGCTWASTRRQPVLADSGSGKHGPRGLFELVPTVRIEAKADPAVKSFSVGSHDLQELKHVACSSMSAAPHDARRLIASLAKSP